MSVDEIFYVVTSISMFFFFVELLLASLAQEDYFLHFYFWLDLVATASLITDIGWIWNRIFLS